jgi:hypothetical protein
LEQVHAATAPKERRAKRQLPTRDEQIKSLQTESFDVLIIGGGASGSGCALDAVTRGKMKCVAQMSALIPLSYQLLFSSCMPYGPYYSHQPCHKTGNSSTSKSIKLISWMIKYVFLLIETLFK